MIAGTQRSEKQWRQIWDISKTCPIKPAGERKREIMQAACGHASLDDLKHGLPTDVPFSDPLCFSPGGATLSSISRDKAPRHRRLSTPPPSITILRVIKS